MKNVVELCHQKSSMCVGVCARGGGGGRRVRVRALHSHNISHPIYRRTLRQSMSANNEIFFQSAQPLV